MRPVALITGGSRGIGYGIAKALAGIGYDLMINGVRDHEQVLPALEALSLIGNTRIHYCKGNIASAPDRSRLVQVTREVFGKLNILVNNAGMAPRERKDILEASEESFEEVIRTNLQGPYFLTQAVANWLIEQKQAEPSFLGSIINISSISATIASVNRGEYCISKAGISMMTGLFAIRLGEFDLPVYEIRPGITETDMTAGVKEKYDKLIGEGLTVQRRWGYPEDIGKAVVALAQGLLPYSTGQVIMIDGGLTLGRL